MKRTAASFVSVCIVLLPATAMVQAARFAGGTGTAADPYQIATAAQLLSIGSDPNLLDKHFLLTADIDLDPNLPTGRVFDKAIIAPDANATEPGFQGLPFSGVFDGNDRRILHAIVKGGDYVGLFGNIASSGEVKNLRVVDINMVGSGQYIGGLAGCSAGTVARCYSMGSVGGRKWVGGLVGGTYGTISDCYSSASVRGAEFLGGLAGYNGYGRISTCYSKGSVRGGEYVGGLLGYNYFGTVSICYSVGPVSGSVSIGGLAGSDNSFVISACFWDTQTSKRPFSAGGTGKTTAEMKTAKLFLDAKWDFVGETANGTKDIWWIDEGKDYPRLWWEARD